MPQRQDEQQRQGSLRYPLSRRTEGLVKSSIQSKPTPISQQKISSTSECGSITARIIAITFVAAVYNLNKQMATVSKQSGY